MGGPQAAHARARDAVHHALDVPTLTADLRDAGLMGLKDDVMLSPS